MVFFTSLLIVVILYYLQADGIIYVTIIAVVGELINIFMTQTVTKATEKKTTLKFSRVVHTYQTKINVQKKNITELENIQEESVKKIMATNKKIKEYEEKIKTLQEEQTPELSKDQISGLQEEPTPVKKESSKNKSEERKTFDDLPPGSNRKKLPN